MNSEGEEPAAAGPSPFCVPVGFCAIGKKRTNIQFI